MVRDVASGREEVDPVEMFQRCDRRDQQADKIVQESDIAERLARAVQSNAVPVEEHVLEGSGTAPKAIKADLVIHKYRLLNSMEPWPNNTTQVQHEPASLQVHLTISDPKGVAEKDGMLNFTSSVEGEQQRVVCVHEQTVGDVYGKLPSASSA